jgi:CNT family concentrative nucleoside transporter
MVNMTAGMAHVSGGIMGAYILSGVEAKHLLTAVIMTAPGTILLAKMMVPETESPQTQGAVDAVRQTEEKHENVLAAAAKGTSDGLGLALNVAAMLISFLAIIALFNGILGGAHNWLTAHGLPWFPASLETIFGWIFAPIAFLIGSPARLPGDRQPAGHAHGDERTGGLQHARCAKGCPRSTLVHYRHLRPLRLRQP